jgi:hypothetical protein
VIIVDNYSEWKYLSNTLGFNEIYIDIAHGCIAGFIPLEKHRIEIIGYYLPYWDDKSEKKVFATISLNRTSTGREENLLAASISGVKDRSGQPFKDSVKTLKSIKEEIIIKYWQASLKAIDNLNDLKKYHEFDKKYYSVKIPDFNWYKDTWNLNNNSFWGFYVGNELKGGFDLFQVSENEYIRLLSSGNESILNIDNIDSDSVYWYLSGIVLSPDWRGSIFADLMMSKIKEIIKCDTQPLKKVGALIASNEGQKLMSRHGFVCSAQLTID